MFVRSEQPIALSRCAAATRVRVRSRHGVPFEFRLQPCSSCVLHRSVSVVLHQECKHCIHEIEGVLAHWTGLELIDLTHYYYQELVSENSPAQYLR